MSQKLGQVREISADADGFLDQMLGASFDHCIPQTRVLKFGHRDVLLETCEKFQRFFDVPIRYDFAPVCLVSELFKERPVVVEAVSI